jgi:archaellum component FlaC
MVQVMATAKKKTELEKLWRLNNPEKMKAYYQKYYIKNKDKFKERVYKWREDNHEKSILARARQRAKRKEFEFNLEVEDIVIPLRCPILDIEIIRNKKEDLKDNSPSLDRIDNAKGYVKGNIMVVSNKANTMKSNASPEQLIKFAQWILKTYDSLL